MSTIGIPKFAEVCRAADSFVNIQCTTPTQEDVEKDYRIGPSPLVAALNLRNGEDLS